MKKLLAILLCLALCVLLFACTAKEAPAPDEDKTDAENTGDKTEDKTEDKADEFSEGTKIKLSALKGPTSIGLLKLISDEKDVVDYTLAGVADEITAPFIKGELDIIAVPCNLASVLYNKTSGNVNVLAVNTLGVLYLVDTKNEIKSIADLEGKTVYSTGKGTTPEFVFNYILEKNGLKDKVTVEFVSEATELATLLETEKASLAILPQPYVTTVMKQNDRAKIALSLTDEWKKVSGGTEMITGVVIAKKDYVEANRETVDVFLKKYADSIAYVNENVSEAADLCVEYNIIPKKPIAEAAIPYCNVRFIGGEDMKAAVAAYLKVLFDQNPQAVGTALPADDFYYLGK